MTVTAIRPVVVEELGELCCVVDLDAVVSVVVLYSDLCYSSLVYISFLHCSAQSPIVLVLVLGSTGFAFVWKY